MCLKEVSTRRNKKRRKEITSLHGNTNAQKHKNTKTQFVQTSRTCERVRMRSIFIET